MSLFKANERSSSPPHVPPFSRAQAHGAHANVWSVLTMMPLTTVESPISSGSKHALVSHDQLHPFGNEMKGPSGAARNSSRHTSGSHYAVDLPTSDKANLCARMMNGSVPERHRRRRPTGLTSPHLVPPPSVWESRPMGILAASLPSAQRLS